MCIIDSGEWIKLDWNDVWNIIIIYSKYFPDSDWLKAHV